MSSAGLVWRWQGELPAVPVAAPGETLTVNREALSKVDLREIHEELIPDWVVARGGIKAMHLDRLRRSVGADPSLGAIVARLGVLVEADPALNAPEVLGLVSTWNAYLDAAGEPWSLAGEVHMGRQGGELWLRSYRDLYTGEVWVGEAAYRLRLIRRADRTNQLEGYLGHMRRWEDGVVVLHDRVVSYALDHVWPLMDEAQDDQLEAAVRPFAGPVRREAAQVLTREQVQVLARTAAARLGLQHTMASIHARHHCGSQFVVDRLPWNGLEPRDLATLERHAQAPVEASAEGTLCPEVTPVEAARFAAYTMLLREEPGLQGALEALVSWVGRAVAVHEAQHAADDQHSTVSCLGCPQGISRTEALEMSAYAASFAHEGSAALSLMQACGVDPERAPERAASVRFVAEQLVEGGCGAGPTAELVTRARALEREVFGRRASVALPGFPARLPVD